MKEKKRKLMEAVKHCVNHLLFLKLGVEAGFVLLWDTLSVEKQEAPGPAHPHG